MLILDEYKSNHIFAPLFKRITGAIKSKIPICSSSLRYNTKIHENEWNTPYFLELLEN